MAPVGFAHISLSFWVFCLCSWQHCNLFQFDISLVLALAVRSQLIRSLVSNREQRSCCCFPSTSSSCLVQNTHRWHKDNRSHCNRWLAHPAMGEWVSYSIRTRQIADKNWCLNVLVSCNACYACSCVCRLCFASFCFWSLDDFRGLFVSFFIFFLGFSPSSEFSDFLSWADRIVAPFPCTQVCEYWFNSVHTVWQRLVLVFCSFFGGSSSSCDLVDHRCGIQFLVCPLETEQVKQQM